MNREQFISAPKASEAFRMGWEALKKHFLEFLLASLIIGAISSVGSLFTRGDGAGSVAFSLIVGLFISGPLSFGGSYFYLRAIRGDDFEISDIFEGFRNNYIRTVFASFLYITLIMIGFMLLIIPGIIIAIRLSFVPYLVLDEGLEPVEAIRTSWDMTRDFSGQIFLFGVIGFFVGILGLLLLIIGIIPAAILIQASFASLYLSIRDEFEEYNEFEEEHILEEE